MCLNQVDHVFEPSLAKKDKKASVCRKKPFQEKIDHVFEPGRSCV